ncbi:MAG TPA: twin-arginine translocase TatA/TatE family subunit [Anaerolineaceae bacterium]|jgi:sec-independent protein translocase protein TatA|nr:twin-arginine translocase TatA/TatE family subunit [Anaerolineaceae bacterium]
MFGGRIGLPELLILLVVILLVFGVGRISKISEELGKSIRSFRDGLNGGDDEEKKKEEKKDNGSSASM